MNEHLVSIVLPVYNGERFLTQSIESILSQTYTNIELIIVDDCSTDKTPEIIVQYMKRDKRVKVVRHEKNMYLPQALNTGFNMAKGTFYTWTSDDNIYAEDAIEHLVEILIQDSTIDVVYGNETIIDDEGNIVSKRDAIAAVLEPKLIPVLCCVGAYFMFKKDVFIEIGGYEDKWFLTEDWQFWLKAYNKGFKFFKTEKNKYFYRDNISSLSATRGIEVQRNCLKLSLDNLSHNAFRYTSEIVMRAYLKCVGYAYRTSDKKSGLACLEMAKQVNSEAEKYLKIEMLRWLEE